MGEKARQYKPSTVRRLDTLSRNECADPDCERKLIARDGETIVSKICHIEAASENGPRFNPEMDDEDRRHFDNLILLCDECHSIIDNPENEEKYPVGLLKSWKKTHETKSQLSILVNKPRLINLAINGIAELDIEEIDEGSDNLTSFNITEKIEFNSIKRNKSLIVEYGKYYTKVNSLYGELERQGSFKKEKLLRNIKLLYVRAKGKYILDGVDKLKSIQDNADNIIEDVENSILENVDGKSSEKDDIAFAIPIIMVDAFMRCKILEKPVSQ
jgi:5-methylcytosine-specific restriction endonuclease McrA